MPVVSEPIRTDNSAEAFAEVHGSHYDVYRRVALNYLHFQDEAEEVVQDAFLRAWRFRSLFRGDCRLSTWICVIVRRECLHRLRRGQARRLRPEIELTESLHPGASDDTFDHLLNKERRELLLHLVRCISRGPGDMAARILDGETIDMTSPANKSARHRAVVELRPIVSRLENPRKAA